MACLKRPIVGALAALFAAAAIPAAAQVDRSGLELGVQIPSAVSSEFNTADIGLGVRVAWRPAGWLGVEAEIDAYPREFPRRASFSAGRIEGLFGATFGSRIGPARPFARLRPGFMRMQAASQPFGCVAIFPPPLACVLGAGRTLLAVDAGGGIELHATPRTFMRVDAGDLMVRYPGPSTGSNLQRRDAFLSHDFRVAAGAGFRF